MKKGTVQISFEEYLELTKKAVGYVLLKTEIEEEQPDIERMHRTIEVVEEELE